MNKRQWKKEKMDLLEEKSLLVFLKRTKEGKYANIEQSSLIHARMPILREETYVDEEYYYSVR